MSGALRVLGCPRRIALTRRFRRVTALLVWLSACAAPQPRPPAQRAVPPPPVDAEAELEQQTRSVIVENRPRLRACYEEALARAPDLEGRVVLVVDVGQDGKVAHVLEARREGLGDDVVRCLARVLKMIPFHDGAARAVRIQVPFVFSRRE